MKYQRLSLLTPREARRHQRVQSVEVIPKIFFVGFVSFVPFEPKPSAVAEPSSSRRLVVNAAGGRKAPKAA